MRRVINADLFFIHLNWLDANSPYGNSRMVMAAPLQRAVHLLSYKFP